MSITIYCVEDINDLKYVGSTKNVMQYRLRQHIRDKELGRNTSSKYLNLYNSIVYELESCSKDERKEREKYWINKIDCVNCRTLQSNYKDYYEKNKVKIRKCNKQYYLKHRELYLQRSKEQYSARLNLKNNV